MRRSAGAILRESRPATIIRSDWRGLPRKTSAPNRATAEREQLMAIISIAQHARPKVTGQIEERRAHCTIFSTLVVSTGMSKSDSSPTVSTPIERTFAPDVDVTGEQQRHEEQHLDEPAPAEIAQRHRPRVEEGDLDVEEQENHRHEVELHRL